MMWQHLKLLPPFSLRTVGNVYIWTNQTVLPLKYLMVPRTALPDSKLQVGLGQNKQHHALVFVLTQIKTKVLLTEGCHCRYQSVQVCEYAVCGVASYRNTSAYLFFMVVTIYFKESLISTERSCWGKTDQDVLSDLSFYWLHTIKDIGSQLIFIMEKLQWCQKIPNTMKIIILT